MRRTIAPLAAALVLVLALPLSARAGLFDDDEARARVEKLRTDLGETRAKTETLLRAQLDFANQVEALKADIAKLRGQIEVLGYDLETAQKRQKDFYVDLDNRLRKIEQQASAAEQQKTAAAAAAQAAAAAAQAAAATEMHDYEAALAAFKAANYKDAASGFEGFVKAYPKSALQPSAHYWEAASLRLLRDFKAAAGLFSQVAEQWPDDAKAPDALLAMADCQKDAGDAKLARKTLELLVAKYPTSSAAQTARQQLKKKQ